MSSSFARAPINIALIKYWGKAEEGEDIRPLNASLSITLYCDELWSEGRVSAGRGELYVNGQRTDIPSRLVGVFADLKVETQSSIPIGAGLASSAAGFASIATAIAQFRNAHTGAIDLARKGSGSACRSMLSGFVLWETGNQVSSLFDELHWPELRVLVLVFDETKKTVSSTEGMRRSVATSKMLLNRESRLDAMIEAIRKRSMQELAPLVMAESDELHYICEHDTTPPLTYLNSESLNLIQKVRESSLPIAYTFDAGPNAFLIGEERDLREFAGMARKHFWCKVGRGALYL